MGLCQARGWAWSSALWLCRAQVASLTALPALSPAGPGIVRASSVFPILSTILLLLGGLCIGAGRFYSRKNNIVLSAGILFVAAGEPALWSPLQSTRGEGAADHTVSVLINLKSPCVCMCVCVNCGMCVCEVWCVCMCDLWGVCVLEGRACI